MVKHPNSVHKVQCDHDAVTSIGLRMQSDMRYKRLDPKLVCKIHSLQHEIFSKHWKTIVIRPLLKKIGLKLIISNYKPVNNLTFLSKVFIKAALNKLVAHFDNNNLMPDYQSVYRAK